MRVDWPDAVDDSNFGAAIRRAAAAIKEREEIVVGDIDDENLGEVVERIEL